VDTVGVYRSVGFDADRRMKESGEQFDDRVIEVCWDAERSTWKYLRTRDDKPNANHKSIMEKIMVSIEDGVEIDAVSDVITIRSGTETSYWRGQMLSEQRGKSDKRRDRGEDPLHHNRKDRELCRLRLGVPHGIAGEAERHLRQVDTPQV